MKFPGIYVERPTIVFTLKSGGDFHPIHVRLLCQQMRDNLDQEVGFICLTDFDFPMFDDLEIKCIPLEYNYPGWWPCLEAFRVIGPVVSLDLDTVILGGINSLMEVSKHARFDEFYSLRSFIPPKRLLSGILAWNGDWSYLLKEFNYGIHSKLVRGDQEYISYKFKEERMETSHIQDYVESIYSYKRNCSEGIPDDCSILVFHGNPRPWQVPSIWEPIRKRYI